MSNVSVYTVCPLCHEPDTLEIPEEGFLAWRNGQYIQDALPELSADKREQLITGTCPSCWTDMFGEEHTS
jgi:cytochrome c553